MAEVRSLSPGKIWKMLVAPGDDIAAGATVFIMEVMKMEIPHEAPAAGTVSAVHFGEGDEIPDEDLVVVEIA